MISIKTAVVILFFVPVAWVIGLIQGLFLAEKKYKPTFNDYGNGGTK